MIILVHLGVLLVFLRTDKVGENSIIVPALVSQFGPSVIVGTVASHIGHGIGGTAAAQGFPAGEVDFTVVHMLLRFGPKAPIHFAFMKFSIGPWDVNIGVAIRATGLKQ